MSTKRLVGKSLEGFTVQKYMAVYNTNDMGRVDGDPVFFVQDKDVADAWIGIQPNPSFYTTGEEYILTDGKTGFSIYPVTIQGGEKIKRKIKKGALAKLTFGEKKILGLLKD